MLAMLDCCGELGYRKVTVERVYRRYGGYRSQFYDHFSGKEQCFLAAYTTESERLCEDLLSFLGRKSETTGRLEGALRSLAEFIVVHPFRAKALFFEVHVAGRETRCVREKNFERLSRALDGALRNPEPHPAPPPVTAEFMVHTIDQAIARALLNGTPEEFEEDIRDLVSLVCHAYRADGSSLRS